MFLRFNPKAAANAQWEAVDENDQELVASGYLELPMEPLNAGDRVNGIVFVATDVKRAANVEVPLQPGQVL
jgi:hypothetical protein